MELIKHKKFSELQLKEIRNKISEIEQLKKTELCVYTTGSYGRLEASANSDIDLFFIDTNSENRTSNLDQTLINSEIIKICRNLELPEFSKDGLYLQAHSLQDIKDNLGSPLDDYKNYFTARMLLLLESRYIYDEHLHDKCLERLIDSYFVDFHDHTINFKPIFLTNDIIRFWKTLCLNYEHRRRRKMNDLEIPSNEKIVAHSKNLKLKFSRKLTCFSFILKVVDNHQTITREFVKEVCKMTPLERLYSLKDSNADIAGMVQEAINMYQWFIDHTQIPSADMLKWISDREERDKAFNKSRDFGQKIFEILDVIDNQGIMQNLVI